VRAERRTRLARRRFFVDGIRGGRAVLSGGEAHHLGRVLRAETGRQYEISDGRSVYLAEIEMVGKEEISFRVLEELPAQTPPLALTLFIALMKFDRFEWALEKATELGAARIVPIETARCEKGLEQAAKKRLERWRKIVRESSQQSRRAQIPEVSEAARIEDALAATGAHRYFLDESGGDPLLAAFGPERAPGEPVLLAIGPEGGWTEAERELAVSLGWKRATLGPLILRAETAVAAAAAIAMSAWLRD
jgi:16S rRNA (uracil1498-N3)-methyltransferase